MTSFHDIMHSNLLHNQSCMVQTTQEYIHTYLHWRPRDAFRSWMCFESILAYSIASTSTPQVGGWRPCPPTHLVRPTCTAASTSWGLFLKHASIVAISSHTPSRTALSLPAAVLLTCSLKSMRKFRRSVEKEGIVPLTLHTSDAWTTNSPVTLCVKIGSFPGVPVTVSLCDEPEVRSGPECTHHHTGHGIFQ